MTATTNKWNVLGLCDGLKQEMEEIKTVMKEMAPALKIMIDKNYLNASLLSKMNDMMWHVNK